MPSTSAPSKARSSSGSENATRHRRCQAGPPRSVPEPTERTSVAPKSEPMTYRQAADFAIEEQIKAQSAWVENTGDVTDPGDLGMLVAALEALADRDEHLASVIFAQLAVSLREGDEREAIEQGTPA